MKFFAICIFSLCLALSGSRAEDQKDSKTNSAPSKADAKEVALIDTTDGEMVLEFWPEVAPGTVENFKNLAREGFYNGTAFHRIIKGFMIQGGDPNTKDKTATESYGKGGPGYTIKGELSSRNHARGVISMAHRPNDVNSAGSQFFICLDDAPHLNGQYTAFGKLIKGDDVLTKIGNTPVSRNAYGEPSVPKERIEIKNIKIVPADSIK
jgi:peptidyl-prolyl cis-trans isomerase B (cyclophilin B)